MTWYLTFRGLCVLAFVLAGCALLAAVGYAERRPGVALRWIVCAITCAIAGSILLSFGWTAANP